MNKNKKTWTIVIAVLVILGIFVGMFAGSYNKLVNRQAALEKAQADVEVQLQRRSDLIPNLVSTVKGYAAHEEEVFTEIAKARAQLAGAKGIQEQNAANDALDSALSRLLVVVEKYPDLKANEQFINLQYELSGTENRLSKARQDYNEQAQIYNAKIKTFPTVLVARMFGFTAVEYFEAQKEAQTVPVVEFS